MKTRGDVRIRPRKEGLPASSCGHWGEDGLMRPAQKEIVRPPGLQNDPWGQTGVSTTAALALPPRGTLWPGQLQGEPHPRGLCSLPSSVLLVSVMGHARPHTWWCFAWQHHQTDPRQSTLPVMTKSKLVLALRASLNRTALSNLARTRRVIQPVWNTL